MSRNIQLTHGIGHCLDVIARAAAPRKWRSASQWADSERVLTTKQGGEPGRYRTSRTPLLKEIMDCFSPGSNVHDIAVRKPSQYGASEMVVNIVGYVMDEVPCPMMVMLPTLENRDKWKAQKLNPMLQDTPAIRDILGGLKVRDATNSKDMIDFPGGVLFLSGGNSPNSYAQVTVRIIILDDYERFPVSVGNEGDVETLADGRTKAVHNAIRCKISTPAYKGGLIDRAFEDGDQRYCHVPCPHCGEYQKLEWGGPDKGYGIKWNHDLTEAWYLCRHCAAEIHEHQKPRMINLDTVRWVAEAPKKRKRSYTWNSLYCAIGLGPSWLDLARQWVEAQGDTEKLQAFVNTALGEPWEQKLQGADPVALMMRLEEYQTPLPVHARVVGVDVQKDRLEISVYEIGAEEETWADDHYIIEGDTAGDEPWEELDDLLKEIKPDAAGIDTGYNTDQANEFCRGKSWAYPIKGIEGRGKPLIEDEQARRRRLRHKRKKGFSPHLVSDYAAMALLLQRLSLEEPGKGYIHFPKKPAFDDEFFAQLTCNRLEEKRQRGKTMLTWVQTRVRNEAYDTWKMALAAYRLAKLDGRKRTSVQTSAQLDAADGASATTAHARPRLRRNTTNTANDIINPEWSKRL